jgi:Protein of unknown function (DUF2510)
MSTTPAGWFPDPQQPGVQRYWDGAQWTEHTAPLPAPLPVSIPMGPPAPPVALSTGMHATGHSYVIREDGKNGTVQVFDGRVVRTMKKMLGKDDVQTFPIRAITSVSHDRKTLGTDEVRITFGSISYEWKVKDAERFVAEVQTQMFG